MIYHSLIQKFNDVARSVNRRLYKNFTKKGFDITPEQSKKGFNWLWNLYKTPGGRERKNNPYGWREIYVLENFDGFTLEGFHDTSRYGGSPFYVPIYNAWSKPDNEGHRRGFEYYVSGGEVHIIG